MPLIVISGKHDFLSSRYLNTLLGKSKNPVIYDSPQNMAGSFDGADLVVIHNPEEIKDLLVYTALDEIKALKVVLYLTGDNKGNTKVGKFIASLPKEQHKIFPFPPPWKLHGEACSFLLEEVKKYGKAFSHERLPSLLIERVGTDLGILSYELLKLVHVSDPEKTITPEHFKGSLSLVFDVGLDGLVDGLRHRDTKKVAKSLYAINPSMKKESLFRILGYLESHLFTWLRALPHLKEDPEDAARSLGMKSFPYKENILPAIKKWNFPDLRKLLTALALTSRSIKDGNLLPAYQFFSSLLLAVEY